MGYLLTHLHSVGYLTLQHSQLVGLTLLIGLTIAIPLALLLHYLPRLTLPIMGLLGTLYTIPSLALIILLVPLTGLNNRSVILAMVIYTQVILVRTLTVGLRDLNPAILEAATGMGMTGWQRWWWVQVPLLLPVLIAGVRLAAIVAIAIATIGAKFNAGGLGTLLFEGIQTNRYDKIWAGAIAVSLLAFVINGALRKIEHIVDPRYRIQAR